jgi:hypothetical protein
MHAQLQANAAIIKLVGIFEDKYSKKFIQRFTKIGYKEELFGDQTKSFLKNTFYPEFRDLLFLGQEESSVKILQLQPTEGITFKKKAGENVTEISTDFSQVELFLFPNGLHFFSIQLSPRQLELAHLSDVMYCARSFDTSVHYKGVDQSWVSWIEDHFLDGIQISSKDLKKIHVDEFSGSKFKLFSIIDIPEAANNIDLQTREHLLYDLGSVAQIGTAGGNSYFTPSPEYFASLMEDKIAVFNNYTILPLFDTFTVVGEGVITSPYPNSALGMKLTWTQTYFRIYLYNIFIKYNLFRYNLEMGDDSVKVRDEFENFLNTYNLSHISYNFLPNLIFHQHRKGLQIDEELEKFQERINRISQAIQEDQQKRSNLLLGLVGAMTSISGIQPVIEYLEIGRKTVGLGYFSFYLLVVIIAIILAVPLLAYLFPEKKKKIVRKWKQRKA